MEQAPLFSDDSLLVELEDMRAALLRHLRQDGRGYRLGCSGIIESGVDDEDIFDMMQQIKTLQRERHSSL